MTGSPSVAATPLRSLTAAVIDTETTSLDIKVARIVELGVVPLADGRVMTERAHSVLVNPGLPIPAASTAVHGIGDGQVKEAPGFADAWPPFDAALGDHLLVGYALDFDLAVLAAECQRARLPLTPRRWLDIRDLVTLLELPLPDVSLDTVAAWLGLEFTHRHRAVGDAIVTGEILLALLPRLRERGLRTLGEATEACRVRSERLQSTTAGAIVQPRAASPLARVDAYAYRHRVGEAMGTPPRTVLPDAPLKQALATMVEAKISSLFVEPRDPGAPWGILTERDVLRALAAQPRNALSAPVERAASYPLETVMTTDFLYRAYGRMRRKRFRHLGVVDGAGVLVGALTQRDLLRLRADDAIAMTDALDEAADTGALAAIWRKLSEAAAALLAEDVDARDIAAIISGEVCALTARAAWIAERDVGLRAARPAGLRHAVMVLGSGGRGESLLALDQDNAIVYDGADDADAWLAEVGRRMNAILDEVGVPLCKGGVMAGNAAWRKSSTEWRRQVSTWLTRTSPNDILNADIFFDAVPVHGDAMLAEALRGDAIEAACRSPAFLKLMAVNVASIAPTLGWFGRFRTDEDGRMDLKKGGIMPIFAAARILALKHGVPERSTRARLDAMRGRDEVPQRTIDTVLEAHRLLLKAILNQQLADIASGRPPSSRVDPRQLSTIDRDRVRWALEQVRSVRDLLGDPVS